MRELSVSFDVNGRARQVQVPARMSLADVLRDRLELTGTHLGCEHGVCGACTVLLDGRSVRSCLVLAAQAEGRSVTTIEGLSPADGGLSPLQEAMSEHGGIQCGFCTPGMVVAATELLADVPRPSETEVREALSGNLCRCTGYEGIVDAVCSLGSERPPVPSRWNHRGPPPGSDDPAAPPVASRDVSASSAGVSRSSGVSPLSGGTARRRGARRTTVVVAVILFVVGVRWLRSHHEQEHDHDRDRGRSDQ